MGSLVCGLLLVLAVGCTCRLYSLRMATISQYRYVIIYIFKLFNYNLKMTLFMLYSNCIGYIKMLSHNLQIQVLCTIRCPWLGARPICQRLWRKSFGIANLPRLILWPLVCLPSLPAMSIVHQDLTGMYY